MKKFVILIAIVVLAFAGYLTWLSYQPMPISDMSIAGEEALTDASAASDPAMSAEAAAAEVRYLDYEAIKALYPEDMVVMSVYGEDVLWADYYGWLQMGAKNVESYFEQMALYYGIAADWEGSMGEGSDMVYAEYPAVMAKDYALNIAAINELAERLGIEPSEKTMAALEEQAMAEAALGEGADLEEFKASLAQMGISIENYRAVNRMNLLMNDMMAAQFGENFELVSDTEAAEQLEADGYLSANHILFMTMDKNTGEALDQDSANMKKAQADEIYAELAAIEDVQELVRRFVELKAELCEDGGKTAFPEGYTFTPGTMVEEFENAVTSMGDYGLSEPVQTSYGWHIILRLPLGADSLLNDITDAQGNPIRAAEYYAQTKLGEQIETLLTDDAVSFAEGFVAPDMRDFIK